MNRSARKARRMPMKVDGGDDGLPMDCR